MRNDMLKGSGKLQQIKEQITYLLFRWIFRGKIVDETHMLLPIVSIRPGAQLVTFGHFHNTSRDKLKRF